MKRLNRTEKNLKRGNSNIPACAEVGDSFNLTKRPHIVKGVKLYLCECGSVFGILQEDVNSMTNEEVRELERLAGKLVTTMSEEKGVFYSTGFLDEW